MYLVISGTNRIDSNTIRISQHYLQILTDMKISSRILSLQGLNVLERNPDFVKIEQELIVPSQKFIFVSPEYNGSIPGVLKCLFDISDVRKAWAGKKALLTGVSTGRAGNLRGMEDLTGILHFMRVIVHPNKLPISSVDKLFRENGQIEDPSTISAIDSQIHEFIDF
ncbi:MAG TPA: NADPH-dependent FMN reductase [Puia sp.]|nr:NADPH-dependent FMN reductase [Puia sp.]